MGNFRKTEEENAHFRYDLSHPILISNILEIPADWKMKIHLRNRGNEIKHKICSSSQNCKNDYCKNSVLKRKRKQKMMEKKKEKKI